MEDKYALYIKKYNEIENLIPKLKGAQPDSNMKYLEDITTDNSEKNKLYLSRITRNYIQHNSDYKDFIEISDGQLKFLDEIYLKVYGQLDTVKNIMVPTKKAFIKDSKEKISDSIDSFIKKEKNFIVISEENKFVGILTPIDVLEIVNSGIKKTDKFDSVDKKILNRNKQKVSFLKEDALIEEATKELKEKEIIIVTDTGKSTGKILGILKRES